jgi:Tol biopolymer transport system component
MNTRRIVTSVLGLILGTVLVASSLYAQLSEAEKLYQAGIYQLEAVGNFEEAINVFNRLVKEYPASKPLAAKALMKLGLCYERLGNQKATEMYERIIKQYPDQVDLVAQARARLSALSSTIEAGRGPLVQRVLSGADTDDKNFYDIFPSPDGRRVAFVSVYDGSVSSKDLGSGEVQQLIPEIPDTWHYSPRWSPDGRRLVVMEHNYKTSVCKLKLIDMATRTSVLLNETQWHEWIEPCEWSKDGRFILCSADQSCTVSADGKSVTVLPDSIPWVEALSPDGRFVVFRVRRRTKEARLCVQPVAGGPRHEIADCSGLKDKLAVWSPDGRAIAYTHTGGIWVVPMLNGVATGSPHLALASPPVHLWAWTDAGLFYTQWKKTDEARILSQIEMDPSTGEARSSGIQKLTIPVPEAAVDFRWSPDMRRIAVTAGEQGSQKIYICSADSKSITTFQIGQQGFWASYMWWSSDGREFQIQYRDHSTVLESKYTVMALDMASGKTRQLFPYRNDWFRFSASADGKKMAFYRWKNDSSSIRIQGIVVAPFGEPNGKYVALNRPGTKNLDWRGAKLSPQGDRVAFVRQEYPGGNATYPYMGASLWVAGSDGSDTKQLATLTLVRSIVWDPSGRFIAYSGKVDSGKAAASVLRVVEVATGIEHDIPLNEYVQNDLQLSDWSRDGRYIGISIGPHWESDAWLEEHPEFWVVHGLQGS